MFELANTHDVHDGRQVGREPSAMPREKQASTMLPCLGGGQCEVTGWRSPLQADRGLLRSQSGGRGGGAVAAEMARMLPLEIEKMRLELPTVEAAGNNK